MKSFFRLPFRTLSTSSSRMSCCAASFSTTTRPSWTRNRSTSSICSRCWHQQYQPRLQPRHQHQQRRFAQQLADDPHWVSEIDHPAKLVRTGNRNHGPGLIVLAIIPIAAFALGTWQVQRLDWKTKLIAKLEDRLTKPPLPLPPVIDADVVPQEFDYRRVFTTGRFRHDLEMLVGPRVFEGKNGFFVVTPLERSGVSSSGSSSNGRNDDGASTILVNRGWIARDKESQQSRWQAGSGGALPTGEVVVEGLLREPPQKNMFTPESKPQEGRFYFMDIAEMARITGSQPVFMEETFVPELLQAYDREAKGIPIGRPPELSIRNNHFQYIVTWYGLCLATSIMLWMVVRKKPGSVNQRVRQNRYW